MTGCAARVWVDFPVDAALRMAQCRRMARALRFSLSPGSERGDALLEAQSDVLEQIVRRVPLPEILDSLCRIVESQAEDSVRASIMLVDESGTRLRTAAAPSLPREYCEAVDGIEISRDVGTCVAAAARGSVVVTTDIASDPAWQGLAELPLGLGLKAAWSVPMISSAGSVLGTFGTYFLEAREPAPDERRLVDVLARTAALAIEQQRSDEALRESETRYRAIVEASPECVKLVSADGTVLQMNPAGLKMVGAAGEGDVISRSVYDLIAPEHRERFEAFNERVCAGEGGSLDFDIIDSTGNRRSMETTAVPLHWSGHGSAQLAMTRDVTERVAAERALAESRARLDYAVRVAGVGFWYCDLPFEELVWDDRVKEHFFLPADVRVTVDMFYERIHEQDREATRAAIERSIEAHATFDTVYRTVDPASGAIKWIHALGGAAYGPDGTPAHFDGVTVDVTAQKLDEQHLSRLNERLREQDRRKDEFLATLAHELRNPLAPLRTGLHLLELESDPSRASKTREMMDRQLEHLVRMVDDLLDISRVTLGKVTLRKERIDFRDAAKSALESMRPLAEARGHALDLRLPAEPVWLDADGTRVAQVIANILSNSIKYTPEGGRIEFVAERQDNELVVRISDNGSGIEPDMLPEIFDMFVQAEQSASRAAEGLGIGLTLVRRLVEMHGGSVAAYSEGAGTGSSFVIRLPVASDEQGVSEERGRTRTAEEGGLRVLVVDDNVDAAQTLCLLLEHGGHEARVAHSGEEALEVVMGFTPDAAFVDIGLPGINGYELAEQLRADPRLEKVWLIALTGLGTDEDRRCAERAGFDQHLVKPAGYEALRAALANCGGP